MIFNIVKNHHKQTTDNDDQLINSWMEISLKYTKLQLTLAPRARALDHILQNALSLS